MDKERLLSDAVLALLARTAKPLKSREIAHTLSIELGYSIPKSDVNPILYGMLNCGLAVRDNEIRWTARGSGQAPANAKTAEITVPKHLATVPTRAARPNPKSMKVSSSPRMVNSHDSRRSTGIPVNAKPDTNQMLAQQLVGALDAEIETMKNPKKGDSGSSIRIYHGRFLRRTGDVYLYVFSLENFLAGMAMDDIPAEVEIAGTRHSGQIASVQGLEITVGLSEDLGTYIAQAVLITNLWYLLEAVKKRIQALIDANDLPEFPTKAFDLVRSVSASIAYPPPESVVGVPDPKEDCHKAIQLSLGSEVSFIWGPPGTGKTTALARIVEAFWKSGKKVLVCSHTNTAVNTALEMFLDIVHGLPQYEQGKFIRVGVASDGLGDKYALCTVDNVAAKLGFDLKRELEAIQADTERIESQIKSFRILERLSGNISEMDGRLQAVSAKCHQGAEALEHYGEKNSDPPAGTRRNSETIRRFSQCRNAP